MRRLFASFGIVLALAIISAGCAKKTETASTQSSTDSLLSTNPVEQPQGNLTPQEQYQTPPADQQAPPASTPEHKAASHTTTTPRHHTTGGGGSSGSASNASSSEGHGVTVAAGTQLNVVLHTQMSSENAQVGDQWTGEVTDNVIVGQTVVIPAGSTVSGVVNAVQPAESKSRASLAVAIKSVSVNGTSHTLSASTEPVVAGSARARNIGAVAGSAAAGALIGRAVGGSGKGALIGGLIGGAAAAGAAAKSKGYQVVLKDGTKMTFTVDEAVTMKQ